MLDLIAQDYTLFVCVFILVFLLWSYHRNGDKDLLYFISADVSYILGSLCFDTVSWSTDMPVDSPFYCLFYISILLYLKHRTRDLVRHPTPGENIKLITLPLLMIDFAIIAVFSYLVFYYFDRSLVSSIPLSFALDPSKAMNFVYPVLDFAILGYYTYIGKVYILSDDAVYIPLAISAFIWTIGDFLFAFESMFFVSSYEIGDCLQFLGFLMLVIVFLLMKSNRNDADYTTIGLYQERSKFGVFPVLINGVIVAYLGVCLYCLSEFSSASSLVEPVKDLGIVLLLLAILRQSILNYSTQRKLTVLSKDARTDPLTGLYSRKCAFSLIENMFRRSTLSNISISALMLDIDYFKSFNDTWGHSCGDHVLMNVARLARDGVESSGVVCRYGGEEILVVLLGADRGKGMLVAEKIRQSIEAFDFRCEKMRSRVQVTVSIGGATAGDRTEDEFALIESADVALYEAKEERNKVIWSSLDR